MTCRASALWAPSVLPLTPATLRTPDLAEVASGAARAALGLELSAHVVLAEPLEAAPPLYGTLVYMSMRRSWTSGTPRGGVRGGQTSKFPTSLCLFSPLSPGLTSSLSFIPLILTSS